MGDFVTRGTLPMDPRSPALTEACLDLRNAVGTVVSAYTSGTLPAAAAGNYGLLVRVKDANAPELVKICITTSAGAYEWVVVAQSSA